MTTETKVKTAPNSKESEMMVLGCMLTSLNSLQEASEGLDESDFYFTTKCIHKHTHTHAKVHTYTQKNNTRTPRHIYIHTERHINPQRDTKKY